MLCMGSAGEAHTHVIHVVSGQTFHWRQPAFANYYLLSWQTSSSPPPNLLQKAFTAHTYGTVSVLFCLILFRCDSSPCFSITLLMKATINKAWVHRTDTACRRERKKRKTASVPKQEDDAGNTQMVSRAAFSPSLLFSFSCTFSVFFPPPSKDGGLLFSCKAEQEYEVGKGKDAC